MAVTATLSLSNPPPTERIKCAGTMDMKNMVHSPHNNGVVDRNDTLELLLPTLLPSSIPRYELNPALTQRFNLNKYRPITGIPSNTLPNLPL
eukprot:scaffold77122_cov23-Cyclotella_meneghiniana.AAC.1